MNREKRRGGAGGDIHVFVLTKTKIKWKHSKHSKHYPKKRKFAEIVLYEYLTCIEPIKSIVMHTRKANIPIHCRTPFTDAPHSVTV